MSARVAPREAAAQREAVASASSPTPSRSLTVGWLSLAPLLVAHEWLLWAHPDTPRNAGVRVLDLALSPLGEQVDRVRWLLLAASLLAAWAMARVRRVELGRALARVGLEGLLAALALGPVLTLVARAVERWVGVIDVSWDPTASPPALAEIALAAGAGVWEEMLFRLALYSLVYLIALRFATALGIGEGLARAGAELAGLTLSSLAFAAAHFAPVTDWLDLPSREFRADNFAWLALGGVALGVVFRWRGPGVAAWAHALFNVALWIGIDPDVIW